MATIRNRFYPLHDISSHDIVQMYSLRESSGLAGSLVKIVTGTANPSPLATDGWAPGSVGTNIAGTASYRYETKWKVTATASGDTRYNSLGLAMYNTLETDENGLPLKYFPDRAREIGAVISGETLPIVTKGLFGIWGQYIDTSLGNVQPGNLVVVSRSGNGQLAAVDPTNATNFSVVPTGSSTAWLYNPSHVVGKWISSLPTSTTTGVGADFSAQLGYAFFEFNANSY